MAENNIELIAAKDLPTTEAEEVSVLCIDNGELKQKPGASFGGGAGGYVVVPDGFNAENQQGTINESYDNFIDILLAGGTVWVNMTSVMEATAYAMVVMWGFQEGTVFLMVNAGDGLAMTFFCPNGTWTPEG